MTNSIYLNDFMFDPPIQGDFLMETLNGQWCNEFHGIWLCQHSNNALAVLCLVVLLFSSIPQGTNSPVAIEYQAAVATLMHKKGFEVNIHSPYSKCFCCDTQTFTKGQWEIQDSGSTCVVRTRANLLPTWIMIEQADIGALRHSSMRQNPKVNKSERMLKGQRSPNGTCQPTSIDGSKVAFCGM